MDFTAWLKGWLVRHPLKLPEALDRSEYTAQVMVRVRQEAGAAAPASWARSWGFWPRLGLALATSAAGVFVVLHQGQQAGVRLAQQVEQGTALLAAVEEPLAEPLTAEEPDALAEDLELLDTFTLAEAPQSDEAWIQDTVQLLNQLDEDLPEDADGNDATGPSDEYWMQELQSLDESALAASS